MNMEDMGLARPILDNPILHSSLPRSDIRMFEVHIEDHRSFSLDRDEVLWRLTWSPQILAVLGEVQFTYARRSDAFKARESPVFFPWRWLDTFLSRSLGAYNIRDHSLRVRRSLGTRIIDPANNLRKGSRMWSSHDKLGAAPWRYEYRRARRLTDFLRGGSAVHGDQLQILRNSMAILD